MTGQEGARHMGAGAGDDSRIWHAPFTQEQVVILNGVQHCGRYHRYTCGSDNHAIGMRPVLEVFPTGWWCPSPGCGYTQDWAHATTDPFGLVGLAGEELRKKILQGEWFAMEDDLIGGWCIMPVPLQPSSGYPYVGDFIDAEFARHIVNLHNAARSKEK